MYCFNPHIGALLRPSLTLMLPLMPAADAAGFFLPFNPRLKRFVNARNTRLKRRHFTGGNKTTGQLRFE